MKVFNGICLEDTTFVDGDKILELKRGKDYTISEEKGGKVCVFSNFWGWVPAKLFGGVRPGP